MYECSGVRVYVSRLLIRCIIGVFLRVALGANGLSESLDNDPGRGGSLSVASAVRNHNCIDHDSEAKHAKRVDTLADSQAVRPLSFSKYGGRRSRIVQVGDSLALHVVDLELRDKVTGLVCSRNAVLLIITLKEIVVGRPFETETCCDFSKLVEGYTCIALGAYLTFHVGFSPVDKVTC